MKPANGASPPGTRQASFQPLLVKVHQKDGNRSVGPTLGNI